MFDIRDFVRESNRIEGIDREPTEDEISAHIDLLGRQKITIADLECFVSVVQPHAVLRRLPTQNVRVGNHIAPVGGSHIETRLSELLARAEKREDSAYQIHCEYETLHPFTDGNGRSGRVLWLWMMDGWAPLGFLHKFYYQTLDALQ